MCDLYMGPFIYSDPHVSIIITEKIIMSAKVSCHIPNVAPTLTLRRDKVPTTYPPNRKRYALPSMEVIREIEPNYAWTRLPNMAAYRSAIVRNKVCEGLMYLLPGDKNGASLARPYTADLGAMFNEPYSNFKPTEYNEEAVKQSAGIHFSPNTHISRLGKHRPYKPLSNNLNSDSKRKYNNYKSLVSRTNDCVSTESGGKQASTVTAKIGEAEEELQEEVNRILNLIEDPPTIEKEEGESTRPSPMLETTANRRRINSKRKTDRTEHPHSGQKSVQFLTESKSQTSETPDVETERPERKSPSRVQDFRKHSYEKKAEKFSNYKELREAQVPRPLLPENLKSKYLSAAKSDEIWNWLNWDYNKTKFEHFIEVCT